MKKMTLLGIGLTALAALSLVGCGHSTQAGGGSVIQVKLYQAGWGREWLDAEITAFEKAYSAEKYTVDVVESTSKVPETTEGEIETATGKNKNQIDLYFTSNVSINRVISKSKNILRSSNEVLLESFDDILGEGAIGSDRVEEKTTIKDRLYNGMDPMIRYSGDISNWTGKAFTLPWATSATSLIVNPKILADDGLSVPLTSDELITDVQAVAAKTATTNIYPYTWAGNNASGYWNFLFATWFAQYQTLAGFNKFLATTPDTGTMKDNGYDVYHDQGILESLKVMTSLLNLDYSPDGSANMLAPEAQHQFLAGKAAFMVNGDWLLNEMKTEYATEAKAMQIIKCPVLSSIGTEAGLTDAELHTVVAAIDDGKAFSDLSSIVALTQANFDRIKVARGVYNSLGASHQILIPSYSDAKDAAKLFVRFILSQDGCRIFRENAYGSLPFRYDQGDTSGLSTFEQSDLKVLNNGDSTTFFNELYSYSPLRVAANLLTFNYNSWISPTTFKAVLLAKGAFTAQHMFDQEYQYEKDNWSTYVSYLG
jgi:ABC-type glycerol-3-phosphate transport system substrate-binding protein